MREPEFLEAYTGQTIDELISMSDKYRTDSLVLAIEAALYRKAELVGSENLSEEERIVLAVEALEREVNNGGYGQFFVNSSSEFAPMISDSLKMIGCPEVARITEQAIGILGLGDLTIEAMDRVMSEEDEKRDEQLRKCDDMYYNCSEAIANRLFEFVKKSKDKINLISTTVRIV